jgi:hypothetical protein
VGDESPNSFASIAVPEGLALSGSEKAETLADSLEAQLQPVNDQPTKKAN